MPHRIANYSSLSFLEGVGEGDQSLEDVQTRLFGLQSLCDKKGAVSIFFKYNLSSFFSETLKLNQGYHFKFSNQSIR